MAVSSSSKCLTLSDVVDLMERDAEVSEEEASGDDEELCGADYLRSDGSAALLLNATSDCDETEFFAVDTRADPCNRSSLLLLDQSLMEVSSN